MYSNLRGSMQQQNLKNYVYIQCITLVLALFAFVPTIAKAQTPAISIHHTQIDLRFLAKMEGASLTGYVPLPESTKSGVTVGNGVDLGQMDLAEFNRLPLDKN